MMRLSCCSISIRLKLLVGFQSTAMVPGRIAQSVTSLAADTCLTADPGDASSITARSHTFVEINHEIISADILPPPFLLIQERLLSVTSKSMCTKYWLTA